MTRKTTVKATSAAKRKTTPPATRKLDAKVRASALTAPGKRPASRAMPAPKPKRSAPAQEPAIPRERGGRAEVREGGRESADREWEQVTDSALERNQSGIDENEHAPDEEAGKDDASARQAFPTAIEDGEVERM